MSDDPVQETMALGAEGQLWWGCGSSIAWVDDDGAQRRDFGSLITDILPDSKGRLWVCTHDTGVYVCPDRSALLGSTPERVLPALWDNTRRSLSILEGGDGEIWIATTHGLVRYDESDFVVFTSQDGLANDHVSMS